MSDLLAEIWKPIPEFPEYEVSSLGRVRSTDRIRYSMGPWGKIRRIHYKGKILTLCRGGNKIGPVYYVFAPVKGRQMRVNRAVCSAFHGAAPSPSHQAAHLDGDSLNDVPDNLIWATPAENSEHKIGHGRMHVGEDQAMSKLSNEEIPLIFARYIEGVTSYFLAAEFGISPRSIRKIIARQTYAAIPVPAEIIAQAQKLSRANRLKTLRESHR